MIDFNRKNELSKQADKIIEDIKSTDDIVTRLKLIGAIDDIEVSKEIIKKLILNCEVENDD